MVFLATLLSAKRSGSSHWLRAAEVAAIGLTSVVVAAHLWHKQLSATASGDARALLGASKDAVIGTTILLFAYRYRLTRRSGSAPLIPAVQFFSPLNPSQSQYTEDEVGDPDERGGDQRFSHVASPGRHEGPIRHPGPYSDKSADDE
jgi:hypothetical protein